MAPDLSIVSLPRRCVSNLDLLTMILRLFNSLISNGDFQNLTQTSLETDLINVSFAQSNLQSKTTQKKEILSLSALAIAPAHWPQGITKWPDWAGTIGSLSVPRLHSIV